MPELQTILNQWDQDGDGQISKEEAMAAAQQMQKVQDKNKKLIILIAICVVIMGIMLALTIAANEISKDFKPKEGNNMIAKDGSVVATASNVAQRHITDLVNATTSELEDLHFVTLEIEDKSLHYKLAGFILDHDAEPPSLTLLTFTADKIFIQNDKIWVINGTTNPVEWIEVPQTDLVNATIANEKFHTLKGRGGGRGRSSAGRKVGSSVAGGKTTSRSAPKTVNSRTPVPTTYKTTRGGKTYKTDKRCLNPGTWEYCNLKDCEPVRDSLNCN